MNEPIMPSNMSFINVEKQIMSSKGQMVLPNIRSDCNESLN